MIQRVDYYALLSRAVESLERDAYAARGAIYDREHKALLKRLISSSDPCSDADIAREERAFRDAVRHIEFPDDPPPAPRTPMREPEAAWPASGREKARALRRESAQVAADEPEHAPPHEDKRAAKRRWGAAFEPADRGPARERIELPREDMQDDEPGWTGEARKPRPFLRPALAYLLVTVIVVGAGVLGYAYVVGSINLGTINLGSINLSWLTLPSGPAAPQSEQALLYEAGQSGGTGKPVEGKATWGTRTETGGSTGKPDTVVSLDVEFPEPHIALAMTISRVADAGSAMSHLLELRFGQPQDMPFGGVARVSNIAMRGGRTDAAESMVGTSINIAPGQFMFGLLGVEDVIKENVRRLRTQSWLDVTVIFESGAAYTLSVAKGASGERAVNEALANWGQ
jgi:hypothetical protein